MFFINFPWTERRMSLPTQRKLVNLGQYLFPPSGEEMDYAYSPFTLIISNKKLGASLPSLLVMITFWKKGVNPAPLPKTRRMDHKPWKVWSLSVGRYHILLFTRAFYGQQRRRTSFFCYWFSLGTSFHGDSASFCACPCGLPLAMPTSTMPISPVIQGTWPTSSAFGKAGTQSSEVKT